MANADKKSNYKQCGESAGRRKKYELERVAGREDITLSKADHRNERQPQCRNHKHVKQNRRLQRWPETNCGDGE